MDMANLVSNTGNLILTSIFYAPLMPVTLPICLIGLIFAYWVEKFNLTKRHRMPEMINGVLALFLSNLLPYFILLWSISFFVIFDQLYTAQEGERVERIELILPLIAIGIVGSFILFPIRTLINRCFHY